MESQLRKYSIGIASEDKVSSSRWLSIIPIEVIPGMTGSAAETLHETQVSGKDKDNEEYTVTVKRSSSIRAHWLSFDTNRITPPDVKRGEHVVVWQYADEDRFYWSSMSMDAMLRREESVIYAYSATQDPDEILNLRTNMYTVEVSPRDKHVTIHTTQANGEPYEYTLSLNTELGIFFISDNDGRTIQLNSSEDLIRLVNANGTTIELIQEMINLTAVGPITLSSDDIVNLLAGRDLTLNIEGNTSITTKGDTSIKSTSGKVDVEASGDASLIAGGSAKVKAVGGVDIDAGGSVNVKGGANVDISASAMVSISNGQASIKLVGPIVMLN